MSLVENGNRPSASEKDETYKMRKRMVWGRTEMAVPEVPQVHGLTNVLKGDQDALIGTVNAVLNGQAMTREEIDAYLEQLAIIDQAKHENGNGT